MGRITAVVAVAHTFSPDFYILVACLIAMAIVAGVVTVRSARRPKSNPAVWRISQSVVKSIKPVGEGNEPNALTIGIEKHLPKGTFDTRLIVHPDETPDIGPDDVGRTIRYDEYFGGLIGNITYPHEITAEVIGFQSATNGNMKIDVFMVGDGQNYGVVPGTHAITFADVHGDMPLHVIFVIAVSQPYGGLRMVECVRRIYPSDG